MGLVNRVVDADKLLADVLDYAGHLAKMSPRSLVAIKAQLNAAPDQGLAAAINDAVQRMATMTGEADFAEGLAATVGKRAPDFADEV